MTRTPHDELAHCLYSMRYWLDRYDDLSRNYPDQVPTLAGADLKEMERRIGMLREETKNAA